MEGLPATKASSLVDAGATVTVGGTGRRWASRGAHKLLGALAAFSGLSVAGRVALDAGASAGGFTDVLLDRGADHVVAVDVGYGQLDWRLRSDPRVTVHERVNVRHLTPDALDLLPDLVTADLSFISLRLVLPALARCAAPRADFVLLVKPQFEAGPDQVGAGGVVRDPLAWRAALDAVVAAGGAAGLELVDVCAAPLPGPKGNVELFVWLTRGPAAADACRTPAAVAAVLDRAVQAGRAVTDRGAVPAEDPDGG